MRAFMDSSLNIHGTAQSVARAEQGGVHLSIKSRVRTKPKDAFKESVHLWRVHLWRYLCRQFYIWVGPQLLVIIGKGDSRGGDYRGVQL